MSGARAVILETIRRSLAEGGVQGAGAAEIDRRLNAHPANLVPARARLDPARQVALFAEEAERVNATVARAPSLKDVPGLIARYLAERNLPATLRAAPDPLLSRVPWSVQPTLSVSEGPAGADDAVGVTAAFAGIAETGTLALLSGPECPTTLALLPGTHIVILPAGRIVGTYEEVWAKMRARGAGFLPRAVNWITGPSRTADIEQTLLLGAHGPQRLHIVLVDNAEEDA
jgi:L-lactate dehydrogenase complex protein LldG